MKNVATSVALLLAGAAAGSALPTERTPAPMPPQGGYTITISNNTVHAQLSCVLMHEEN